MTLAEADKKRLEDFEKELKELLRKYDAEIETEERGEHGYARGVEHIVVNFNAKYDKKGEPLNTFCDLDLGRCIYPD
jgi:hypothetical protein